MRAALAGLLALLVSVGACEARPKGPGSVPGRVEELVPEVVAVYPHDPDAFTQGLIWHGGRLYESTGGYGSSTLRRVRLETGDVEKRIELPAELFGEGLERVGERLIQLTWRSQLARVYDLDSLELTGELPYVGQGWGLCFDEIDLVRSDGSAVLTLHDAGGFAPLARREVRLGGQPVLYLNELECVDGHVWANLLGSDSIVRIDPATGSVTARVDASSLRATGVGAGAGVLNGIAYRREAGTFLLTGKNWSKLFEVVFVAR